MSKEYLVRIHYSEFGQPKTLLTTEKPMWTGNGYEGRPAVAERVITKLDGRAYAPFEHNGATVIIPVGSIAQIDVMPSAE